MADSIPLTEHGPVDGRNYEAAWQDTYLQAYLLSDVGKKRKNNEDSCLLCAPEDSALKKERGILFAVADGMGGASAGEFASRLALDLLTHSYYTGDNDSTPVSLQKALEQANVRVFEEADANPVYNGMGTTVSAMVLRGDWAYIAQVGDSRVYLLRDKLGLQQITHDHSLVAEQLRNGMINAEEARTHAMKNLITRAVGIKDTVRVDLFSLNIRQGDILLICSDGLCNMVPDDEIAAAMALPDLKTAAHDLIGRAMEAGGSDNITALVIRVIAAPPRTEYQPGAEEVNVAPSGLFGKLKNLFS